LSLLLFTNQNLFELEQVKNKIHHSAAYWPLANDNISLEEFLIGLSAIGVTAVDLIDPEDWPLLHKYGFYCSMCKYKEIDYQNGWNDPINHSQLIDTYSALIIKVAEAGFHNLICLSGLKGKISDETGILNCAIGLNKILPIAKEKGVVLHLEMLSQQVRPGYMADSTDWGVRLCQLIDSENFRLLFDIFHMQRMEGDIIKTIRSYHQYFGHYHVAGVPDRHEIDSGQELYYPAIMKAILDSGFQGHVAQEYEPESKNKIDAIIKGIRICDI